MTNYRRIFTVIFLCALIWVGQCIYSLYSPAVKPSTGITYLLAPGTSKKTFVAELSAYGIVKHPWFYSTYIAAHSHDVLKAGEYLFPVGSSLTTIWQQVTTGKGLLNHEFLIVPGWTFKQIRAEIAASPALHRATVSLTDQQIMAHLGYPKLAPEGEFFPDTYYYTRGASDWGILRRAFMRMQTKLQAAWVERAASLPFQTPYQALIAASLIEKEAYLNAERPMIAGVLVNRLKNNMLLQIDPTVIYGLGDQYSGKLHKSDLQQDSPFNTYLHKGLPPTPIAMPGLASIMAVLHPTAHDYFYYVAKGDGAHQFSETLNEHEAAINAAKNREKTINQSSPASTPPVLGSPVKKVLSGAGS